MALDWDMVKTVQHGLPRLSIVMTLPRRWQPSLVLQSDRPLHLPISSFPKTVMYIMMVVDLPVSIAWRCQAELLIRQDRSMQSDISRLIMVRMYLYVRSLKEITK